MLTLDSYVLLRLKGFIPTVTPAPLLSHQKRLSELGDTVTAQIIKLREDRVSLSMKALTEDEVPKEEDDYEDHGYWRIYSFSYVLLRLIGKHDRIRTAPMTQGALVVQEDSVTESVKN